MVYYGVLSKGCQRCRQRKIKCDQRRPGCLRCEKAGTQCPGFRDLTEITFRDESRRIIRNAHAAYDSKCIGQLVPTAPRPLPAPSLLLPSIPPLPSQRASEIGAHFFFSIYTCDEPPLSNDYHSWLTQIGCEHPHHQALRAAIEAAGMAGSSGIFYAPNVAARAREEYGRAMAATSQALNDPAASILDTTFLTVILLGLVEFINTENWGHHRPSTAHMEGAIALLQHRGQKKFDRERSVQLFYQLRSHILYTLTQYDIPFPSALLQLAQSHRPSFLGDMKFRLLNLRGAIKKGPTSDSGFICETARQMDRELDAWGETLTPSMSYEASKSSPDSTYFKGIRHIYKDLWTAQLWNSWRTISIEVNQLIMESGVRGGVLYDNDTSTAACKIRKMSTDICISVPEIMGSPHSAALIWSLLLVSQEPVNRHSERAWAAVQLHRIGSSEDIQQANLLADGISP